MKRLGLFCLAALLIAVCTGTSYATIVQDWDASWGEYSPTASVFTFVGEEMWTWDIEEIGQEALASFGSVYSSILGEDQDPQLAVTLTVENSTGFTWTGYVLELDQGENATFFGTAGTSGSEFGTVMYPGDKTINFSGTEYVDIGESVTFNFVIDVPNFGDGFTLTQTPIPEPATIALLSVGMLFLKRRSISTERR